MGRYTILDDPAADAAVQEVLDRVCGDVIRLLGNELQAIVLIGGYGRGEGGAYRIGADYCLVNDLDLLAFTKSIFRAEREDKERLEHLVGEWLANGRGLKGIDVELTQLWRYLFFAPNTVGTYEIANGHQVIYGDLNFKKALPRLDPKRLPTYEGANYFRNRGSALLIPALYFLTNGLQDAGKRENFQIEVQKACQAMGDACLLMLGQYHFSYRERLQRFRQIKPEALGIPPSLFEKVTPLYEWGMIRKLSPSFEWPGDKQMVTKWFEVREVFGDFFLWYESERLGHRFKGWDEYANFVWQHGAGEPTSLRQRAALWSAFSFFRRKGRGSAPLSPIGRSRLCLAVMPLLLFSLKPDFTVESPPLAHAAKLMGQTVPGADLSVWKKVAETFLRTFYPTAVVTDALAPLHESAVSH